MAFDRFKTNIRYKHTQEKATTTELELYKKDIETLGAVKEQNGSEHLKMWLLSKNGDYIRDPERGLALRDTIFRKQMNEKGITEMVEHTKTRCTEQLKDFVLQEAIFSPNEANRSWDVYIKGYNLSKEEVAEVLTAVDVSKQSESKEWQ